MFAVFQEAFEERRRDVSDVVVAQVDAAQLRPGGELADLVFRRLLVAVGAVARQAGAIAAPQAVVAAMAPACPEPLLQPLLDRHEPAHADRKLHHVPRGIQSD